MALLAAENVCRTVAESRGRVAKRNMGMCRACNKQQDRRCEAAGAHHAKLRALEDFQDDVAVSQQGEVSRELAARKIGVSPVKLRTGDRSPQAG